MSDRTRTLVVVIEEHRVDDAEPLMEAIRQMRGVVSVDAHVSDFSEHAAVQNAKYELKKKLWEVLK